MSNVQWSYPGICIRNLPLNKYLSSINYSYDPSRPGLLAQVSGPSHTVYNTWEPYRGILKTKTNIQGTSLAETHFYLSPCVPGFYRIHRALFTCPHTLFWPSKQLLTRTPDSDSKFAELTPICEE